MDTFIKHLDDEVNNLEEKQVNDILKYKLDDIIPESKDNVIKNYTNSAWNTSYMNKLSEIDHGLERQNSNIKVQKRFHKISMQLASWYR